MPLHLDGFYCRKMPAVEWNEEKECYLVIESEGEEIEGKWMFLFVDLVFVALISKFSTVMENCALSFHSMSFVSIMMSIMFITRLHLDDYCNRFYVNDLFHRLIYFCYTMCMFIMALNINAAPTGGAESDALCDANLYGFGFACGFVMSRFLTLLLYISLIAENRDLAFYQFIGPCLRCVLSMIIVMGLVADDDAAAASGNAADAPFPQDYRMNIYMAALMIEVGHSMIHHICKAVHHAGYAIDHIVGHSAWESLHGAEHYQLDIEVYQERIGAFLMMVLGEAIIGLLIPYFDVNDAEETYKFTCISCFIIFCYGLEYYDAANTREKGEHAMTHSVLSGFMYTWIHLPLAFGMFFTSSGMSICYEKSKEEGKGPEKVEEAKPDTDDKSNKLTWDHEEMFTPTVLLAAAIGFTICNLAVLRNLHVGIDKLWARGEGKRRCEFFLKCFFGIVHWTVPGYGFEKSSYNAFCHACYLLLMICYEVKIGGGEEEGESEKAKGESSSAGEKEKKKRSVGDFLMSKTGVSKDEDARGHRGGKKKAPREAQVSAMGDKTNAEKSAAVASKSAFASRLMRFSASRKSALAKDDSPSSPKSTVSQRVSLSAGKRSSMRSSVTGMSLFQREDGLELTVDNPMNNSKS